MFSPLTRRLDAGQPVNFGDPLNRGRVCWLLNSPAGHPAYRGGNRWLNLCGKDHAALTASPSWKGNGGRRGGWGSLGLDGSTQYGTLTNSPSLSISGAISVFLWIYQTLSPGVDYMRFAEKSYGTSWFFGNTGDNKISVYIESTSHNMASSGYALNTWNQVGFTYGGGVTAIYVNGVSVFSDSGGPELVDDGENVYIGRWNPSLSGTFFQGSMDSFSIWNRALSASQAAQLYEDELRGCPRTLNRRQRAWFNAAAGGGAKLLNGGRLVGGSLVGGRLVA